MQRRGTWVRERSCYVAPGQEIIFRVLAMLPKDVGDTRHPAQLVDADYYATSMSECSLPKESAIMIAAGDLFEDRKSCCAAECLRCSSWEAGD